MLVRQVGFYKSRLYIGSIPSIRILTLLLGISLEPITQLVELRTFNPLVAGSSPARFIIALGVNPHHYLSDDT